MSNDRIIRSNIEPAHIPYKTVGEYVWFELKQLKDDHVCLIDAQTEEQLTISELKSRSNSISVALINRGITKTDKIAFCGQNSIQHSILRFATYFTGNTFLPLSPTFGKYEVEQEVRDAGANIIFSSAEDLYKFDTVFKNQNNIKLVVVFDGKSDKYVTFEQLLEEGKNQTLDTIPYFDINPKKDMFCLIHTSGSTGRPKCAMISHTMFLNLLCETKNFYTVSETTGYTCAQAFPFGHISGTFNLPVQVIRGAKVVEFGNITEKLLMSSIGKYKITFAHIFPNNCTKLVEGQFVDKYDLSSLRAISTGGSYFPPHIARKIIDKYHVIFKEGYGMTEYLFICRGSEDDEEYTPGSLGRVTPGTEVKIVDLNTGDSLGPGIDGEICVRGNNVFSGYLDNDSATKAAFDRNGWFRTGDIGHYDDKERLFIMDRLKEVIRIGVDNHYINISPVEIEQFLLSHKSIAEVSVVGVNNRTGTQWPRAYIALKIGQTLSANDIEKYVSDTLAYTKQLKGGVVFVDHIQRTGTGKVDRKYYRTLVKDEIID